MMIAIHAHAKTAAPIKNLNTSAFSETEGAPQNFFDMIRMLLLEQIGAKSNLKDKDNLTQHQATINQDDLKDKKENPDLIASAINTVFTGVLSNPLSKDELKSVLDKLDLHEREQLLHSIESNMVHLVKPHQDTQKWMDSTDSKSSMLNVNGSSLVSVDSSFLPVMGEEKNNKKTISESVQDINIENAHVSELAKVISEPAKNDLNDLEKNKLEQKRISKNDAFNVAESKNRLLALKENDLSQVRASIADKNTQEKESLQQERNELDRLLLDKASSHEPSAGVLMHGQEQAKHVMGAPVSTQTSPMATSQWMVDVIEKTQALMAESSPNSASLSLDVPGMGQIDVKILTRGNHVSLEFNTFNQDAQMQMMVSSQDLKTLMNASGLNVVHYVSQVNAAQTAMNIEQQGMNFNARNKQDLNEESNTKQGTVEGAHKGFRRLFDLQAYQVVNLHQDLMSKKQS